MQKKDLDWEFLFRSHQDQMTVLGNKTFPQEDVTHKQKQKEKKEPREIIWGTSPLVGWAEELTKNKQQQSYKGKENQEKGNQYVRKRGVNTDKFHSKME